MVVKIDLEQLSEKTKIALANEQLLNKTIQKALSRDASDKVKCALAENSTTDAEVLRELYKGSDAVKISLAKNKHIQKELESLAESPNIKGEDAIKIAKLHNPFVSEKLFITMKNMVEEPKPEWFKDVVTIWAGNNREYGAQSWIRDLEYAAYYISLLPLEDQYDLVVQFESVSEVAAKYTDNPKLIDILMREPITRVRIELINNVHYEIRKLARKQILAEGTDYEILSKLAEVDYDLEKTVPIEGEEGKGIPLISIYI